MKERKVPRWRHRLEKFRKAYAQLHKACARQTYSNLERAGLFHIFEFTFQQGLQTIEELLFHEGFDEETPRSLIRRAFEAGHLEQGDAELWLEALEMPGILSHAYEETTAQIALQSIREKYSPLLERTLSSLIQLAGIP